MLDERRVSNGLNDLLGRLAVPPAPIGTILSRQVSRRQTYSLNARFAPILAAACIAIVIAANPAVSRSLVETVSQKIAALLRWTPPSPPPKELITRLHARNVTFDEARKAVSFALVAPLGLPSDAVQSSITVVPTARFAKNTWSKGSNAVMFAYKRNDGRSFRLLALAYAQNDAPSRYMLVETGTRANGEPIVRRHEQFAWRNGSQQMRITDDGISAAEIGMIRTAMKGRPIVTQWPPKRRGPATMFVLKR